MTKTYGTCCSEVCEGGGVKSSGFGEENELVEASVNVVPRLFMQKGSYKLLSLYQRLQRCYPNNRKHYSYVTCRH